LVENDNVYKTGGGGENMSTSITPVEIPFLGYRAHHQYIREELKDRGVHVPTFTCPADSFAYLNQKTPGVMVVGTDFESHRGFDADKRWDMEDSGGQVSLEVIRRVRQMPKYTNITPIVVINSWGKDMERRLKEVGATEVMNLRDVMPSDFVSVVMRHLKRV